MPDVEMLEVCPVEELPPGHAVRAGSDPVVAVFNVGGTLYAIEDSCSHQGGSLASGFVSRHSVHCPIHLAGFSLEDGHCVTSGHLSTLRTFATRVRDGVVFVENTAGMGTES